MFFIYFIIIFMGSFFLPWWWFVLPLFILGLFSQYGFFKLIGYGFFTSALSWAMMAYYMNHLSDERSSVFISSLLKLPSPWMSYLLTAAIAGILGALFSITGYFWRKKEDTSRSLFV